jgi:hypothetical protein
MILTNENKEYDLSITNEPKTMCFELIYVDDNKIVQVCEVMKLEIPLCFKSSPCKQFEICPLSKLKIKHNPNAQKYIVSYEINDAELSYVIDGDNYDKFLRDLLQKHYDKYIEIETMIIDFDMKRGHN